MGLSVETTVHTGLENVVEEQETAPNRVTALTMRGLAALSVFAAALLGCTVGPNFRPLAVSAQTAEAL